MPIQLIDISSSHSTLLFFLAWQKNVFPPLLPIVPTPCGTFYKGPTRPLLSIGKSIIKDSVNMNVARIHILFKNQWSWSFVFEAGTQNHSYPQISKGSQLTNYTILLTFWQSFRECVIEFEVFTREKNKSINPILAKNGPLWKKELENYLMCKHKLGKKGKREEKAKPCSSAQHGLRTPNEGINQRNWNVWAECGRQICFGHN